MTISLITSVTGWQKKQVLRFCEDALDHAIVEGILDKDRCQKLIENGDDFQNGLDQLIERLSVTNQYANEEVESSYGYFSGYKPKGITEQTNRLRELFPGIGYANERLAEQPLPPGAEGWFAIPRWDKVAKTYPEALLKVFEAIYKTRGGKFYNYRGGRIYAQHIRQMAKTVRMFKRFDGKQEGYDILIVPCQFGLRHRGRSVRRAWEVMSALEFGLDPFSVACMLLTHPERLQHFDDLWIDCAGAYYYYGGRFSFDDVPCFGFFGGEVKLDAHYSDYAYEGYGSASGFVPQ